MVRNKLSDAIFSLVAGLHSGRGLDVQINSIQPPGPPPGKSGDTQMPRKAVDDFKTFRYEKLEKELEVYALTLLELQKACTKTRVPRGNHKVLSTTRLSTGGINSKSYLIPQSEIPVEVLQQWRQSMLYITSTVYSGHTRLLRKEDAGKMYSYTYDERNARL